MVYQQIGMRRKNHKKTSYAEGKWHGLEYGG